MENTIPDGEGQLKFLGHYIRKGKLEDLCLAGRIDGKRARGRPRKTYLNNFQDRFQTTRELWDAARDRNDWRRVSEA